MQAGTDYAVAADAGSATVTVRDDDMPAWAVTVDPEEIAEADTGAATVTVSTGGVTFAAERTIELEIAVQRRRPGAISRLPTPAGQRSPCPTGSPLRWARAR